MIYVVVALKAEAQAFVDSFALQKSKLAAFTLYSNTQMRLIISGMGVANARVATQTLINHFDISDDDIYYNIGICAASKHHQIGEILEIGAIVYEKQHYLFEPNAKSILCADTPLHQELYEIVDMESFGFYDAAVHNPAIKNFSIIKVVSDHFEPQSITKDGAKQLLSQAIKRVFSSQFSESNRRY